MWGKISNINSDIIRTIKSYKDASTASELTSWIRVFSGADSGLILQSNTSNNLIRAVGEGTTSIYGDAQSSGIIGTDWGGKVIETSNEEQFLRPSPIITAFDVTEGNDQISRVGTMKITAFTLAQMEEIQKYFLEPGYSLFIEWGWNTPNGYGSIVKLFENGKRRGTDKILGDISSKSLNQDNLEKTRFDTSGQYDCYLGFIVGGGVSSAGENFEISVDLRGAPSLPTYLQSYQNTKQIDTKTEKVINSQKSIRLFGIDEVEDEDTSVVRRRFGYMFNELPSTRQTEGVKNLLNDGVTENQFVNFDKHIEKGIQNGSTWFTGRSKTIELKEFGASPINVEDLFSENKYIRMDLAVRILNEIGVTDKFVVGGKNISFKIDIDDCIIGGFPNMFSTNAKKLLIPGQVPDFFKYFLNATPVEQLTGGNLKSGGETVEPINPDPSLIPFLENKKLVKPDAKEKEKYYGYLKHLFINFDVFKSKLEQKNKSTAQIFLDMLNELSSAANSFWNFQIVEGKFQQTNILSVDDLFERGQFEEASQLLDENGIERKTGDIKITVIDENWIGELPFEDKEIEVFEHRGVGSIFTSANLNINFPAAKVGQVIANRLGSSVNPDLQKLSTTNSTFFNSTTDLFLPLRNQTTQNQNYQKDKSKDDEKPNTNFNEQILEKRAEQDRNFEKILEERKKGNPLTKTDEERRLEKANQDLTNDINDIVKQRKESYQTNLTANLEKLDIVPRSSFLNVEFQGDDDEVTNTYLRDEEKVREDFAIFCFNDSDYFDRLKIDALAVGEKYKDETPKGLSIPLPIEYEFEILGNSGIRRGDVFKINGIPSKYKDRGVFHVSEVSQTLQGSKWVTSIKGLYRQIQ